MRRKTKEEISLPGGKEHILIYPSLFQGNVGGLGQTPPFSNASLQEEEHGEP